MSNISSVDKNFFIFYDSVIDKISIYNLDPFPKGMPSGVYKDDLYSLYNSEDFWQIFKNETRFNSSYEFCFEIALANSFVKKAKKYFGNKPLPSTLNTTAYQEICAHLMSNSGFYENIHNIIKNYYNDQMTSVSDYFN